MKTLIAHDTPEALLAGGRSNRRARTSHPLLAIRDVMLGRAWKWVYAQYGVRRDNLWHGVLVLPPYSHDLNRVEPEL
jgi:transposase